MSKKLTTEEVQNRANDMLSIKEDYVNANQSILVKCKKCGREYHMPVKSILNGRGCRYCANNVVKNTSIFQDELNIVYGISVFKVLGTYKNTHDYILIENCKTGDKFKQSRTNMLKGTNSVIDPQPIRKEVIKEDSGVEVKGTLHKFNTWTDPKTGIKRKIHTGQRSYNSSGRLSRFNQEELDNWFKGKIKDKYGDRIKVISHYTHSKDKVNILCSVCGFESSVSAGELLANGNCPICSGFTQSKGERMIYSLLSGNGIEFDYHYSFHTPLWKNRIHFDFYIPKNKVAIEFDGIQHYDKNYKWYSPKGEERDRIKDAWAKELGVTLLRVTSYNPEEVVKTLSSALGYLKIDPLKYYGYQDVPIKEIYEYLCNGHTYTEAKNKYHIDYSSLYSIVGMYTGKRIEPKKEKILNEKDFRMALVEKWGSRFTLLTEYKGYSKKCLFHCNSCGQDFYSVPGTLLGSKRKSGGCPYCAHCIHWTISSIVSTIKELYPLDGFSTGQYVLKSAKYINSGKPLQWHCNKCGRDFTQSWYSMKSGKACRCSSSTTGDGSTNKSLARYRKGLSYKF